MLQVRPMFQYDHDHHRTMRFDRHCCDRRHRDCPSACFTVWYVRHAKRVHPTVLGWRGSYLSCHPEGMVAQELMGALSSGSKPPIASVPQKTWVPQRSAAPLSRDTPSRCQTLMVMPDPDACHTGPRCHITPSDPAVGPRHRIPRSDPTVRNIRSGYIYEICVCIECVTLHVVHT